MFVKRIASGQPHVEIVLAESLARTAQTASAQQPIEPQVANPPEVPAQTASAQQHSETQKVKQLPAAEKIVGEDKSAVLSS